MILLHLTATNFNKCFVLVRDILKVLLSNLVLAKVYREGCSWVVGQGSRTCFGLVSNKNTIVGELGSFLNGRWQWDLGLRRRLFNWERPRYNELIAVINLMVPSKGTYSIIWKRAPDGIFSVKNGYSAAEIRVYGSTSWLLSKHCRKLIPHKVCLFMWQLKENRVAFKENLMKRGVTIENGGNCETCGLMLESSLHLALWCNLSWKFRYTTMAREGIDWCIPGSVAALLEEWPFLC